MVEATGGGQRRAPRPSAVGVLFGVWSVVASGCALDTPAKYLAPEGAQSYLIIEVGGEGISVEALGRPEGRSYDGDDLRQLYVLGYAESLAQLGLPAGLLRVDATGGPLPKPIWIRGLDHAANEDGTFESLAELPAMIRDLRLAEVSPCPDLVPDALTYGPNAGRTYFFVKLDADRGLLGSSAGLFLVESSTITYLPQFGPQTYTGAFAEQATGTIWMARNDGVIVRGTLEGGFVEGIRFAHAFIPGTFGGPLGGDGSELYGATTSTTVWWYREGTLESVAVSLQASPPPMLASVEPGLIAALRQDTGRIFEISGSPAVARLVDAGIPARDQVRSITQLPQRGTMIGTELGELYERRGGIWQRALTLESSTAITVAVPAFGGLFLGGEDMVFSMTFADGRICPPAGYSVVDNHEALHAIELGGSVYVAHMGFASGPARVTRIRLR